MKGFWQAPGRSKLFNTPLKYWDVSSIKNKSSIRSIAVLKFINDNPGISVKSFKDYFIDYFNEFEQSLNLNSTIELSFNKKKADPHFFKVLLFCNFISVDSEDDFSVTKKFTNTKNNDKLYITVQGKMFLDELKEKNYDNALNIYLNNLFKVKYPNKATYKVNLEIYPFLIMFKLLSENNDYNGLIPRKLFITDIPFITKDNYNNILEKLTDNCYLLTLEHMNNKIIDEDYKDNHKKWNMWVVSSLIDLGILEEHHGYIKLSNYKKQFIQNKVDSMSYEDMFE